MRKTLKTYVILGIAMGTVLASGAVAFADTGSKTEQKSGAPTFIKMERLTSSEDSIQRPERPEMPEMSKRDGKHKAFKMNFDSFVESGIISRDTADEMTAYLEAQQEKRMSISRDSVDQLQEESADCVKGERIGGIKGERVDFISDMVESGILTQEEADEIKAAQIEMMTKMMSEMRAEIASKQTT